MADVIINDIYLSAIADAIRLKLGTSSTYTPPNMAPAIRTISGGSVLQSKTVEPTTSQQLVTPDSGYDGLSSVTVNAITAGTSGTPVATKGSVSNHSISVTPQVTNTTGYITGGVKTGTAVTVTASELVSGTLSVTTNGTKDVTNYASISVNVSGDVPVFQDKTVSPTESIQVVEPDSNYDALSSVTVNAISSTYVGSGITQRSSTDLSASGATVTAPAGYYAESASKSVATGTAGTPTATKGTVSNHSVSITPSVTNTTGYITGSTKTGTAVTVLASELVSGNKAISANGTGIDVTNYATVSVAVGSTINNQNKTVTPTTSEQYITADSGYTGLGTVTVEAMPIANPLVDVISGYSTVSSQRKWSFTPNASAGVHYGYDAGYFEGTVVGDEIVYNAIASNTTITPTESNQTIGGANTMMEGAITVSAISSDYVGSAIDRRDVDDDVFQQGDTIYIPEGYYDHNSAYVIPGGVATAPTSISGTTATVSTGTNTLTLTKSISVIPSVTAGFITTGTAGNSSVSLTASVTVNPTPTASGATVTIPAGYYSSQTTKSVSSLTLPTSTSSSATSGYTNKATITPSTSDQYLNIGTGYNSTNSYYKINAMSAMTLPTSTAASATSGYTSKAMIGRSTSDQYINIPTGYNSAGAYYKISAVANGSATPAESISGTSATVSTGTNTLTLTKTVSNTPQVSAGYISSGTSGNTNVSLTASITTKAAATITPGTSNQTIESGTYLTGTQTISGDTNLVAGNIKDGVSIFGVTGTYEGEGGGGSSILVGTKTATPATAGSTITFTGLSGEPTSFAIASASDLATGASPFKVSGVVYDGTNVIGQTVTNTSNAQVTYDGTNFSKSYSNGTLTVTSSSAYFQANEYKLTYSYNGSTSDVSTADVQVGSGATSITFTGLTDEPTYFSCIFKSNFSTSSGYQRVIMVVHDGISTYGMEMDSSAKASTSHWSYTYNNGSLTISSSGTNTGGYFHQPGYYQLTYVISDGSGDTGVVTAPSTITGTSATVSTGTNTLTLTKTVSVTPDVTTPGYISRGTAGNSNISLTASVTTKAAATITPGTTNQTIAAGTYLTGTQTISGDADLVGSNILSTANIFGVQGTVVIQSYYTGSSAPSSSLGNNGDLYLQT